MNYVFDDITELIKHCKIMKEWIAKNEQKIYASTSFYQEFKGRFIDIHNKLELEKTEYHILMQPYIYSAPRASLISSEIDIIENILHKLWEEYFNEMKRAISCPEITIPMSTLQKQEIAEIQSKTADNKSIFIVHGHDNEMKESVARFIEKIGYTAVILHEQPNGGKTIIEKFECNAEITAFAIVILSPDDEGFSKQDGIDFKKNRARQNVVFEYGYFSGKLGRSNVVALYKESNVFELPSDLQGITYTPFDSRGYWKTETANELIAAGFKVDKNKI